MDYCVKYNPHFKYWAEVRYVRFFEGSLELFDELYEFHQNHSHIIMRLEAPAHFIIEKNIVNTAKMIDGIIVITDETFDDDVEQVIAMCKGADVPFSFGVPITKWDNLNFILSLGVRDVLIGEELCFCTRKLKNVCKNIPIMMYPNVAQNGAKVGNATDFFIRPEDLKRYEDIIDICSFHSTKMTSLNATFEIYVHDGYWNDELRLLIPNLEMNFWNVLPDFIPFGEMRMNCEKKCGKGGSCGICTLAKETPLTSLQI